MEQIRQKRTDIVESKPQEPETEQAILVGVNTPESHNFTEEMAELGRLAQALGLVVIGELTQELARMNPGSYIGSGKLMELSELVRETEAAYVVFADTLSPSQLKRISEEVEAVVYDRTGLILEIFKRRARTREARLQVEMAELQYLLPRLVGMRTSLGRQGGTSGSMSNRGQGEKQIELDRRHIEKRLSQLRRELSEIEHDREIQRRKRARSGLPRVAMVGYTNAGKSTLMNALLKRFGGDGEKQVFEKDMLFATLDTSVRRIVPGDKRDFLFSDTVGFVNDLPHGLIRAFRSTLDEAREADLLLIVADASDEGMKEQIQVTLDTLKELSAQDIPRILVKNKADRLEIYPRGYDAVREEIYISAVTGEGLEELVEEIRKKVYGQNRIVKLLIPYTEGKKLNLISENARVISREYLEEGVLIEAECPLRLAGQLGMEQGQSE